MRTSSILPLILTASGMQGGWNIPPIAASKTAFHELNFRWRNQRQVRKNARRAHAAGKRNAFA